MISESIQNLKSKIQNFRLLSFLQTFRRRKRGRLVRHYFLISLLLIAGGLISSAALEIYFRYRESEEQIALLEQQAAAVAALKIERFVQDIVTAIKSSTKSREVMQGRVSPEYRFELKRLLYLTPAITEAMALDIDGVKQAHVSRAGAVSSDARSDFAPSAGFQRALQGKPEYGPVYFVQNSEPYMTIAYPIEQYAGTVIGVIRRGKPNTFGMSSQYPNRGSWLRLCVTRSGDLIAHRDISLVLRRQNLAHLAQVQTAFQVASGAPRPKVMLASNLEGKRVISSHAFIPSLQWMVFIERPAEEAYTPLYASMLRTSGFLLVGFSGGAGELVCGRRVVRPIESLDAVWNESAKGFDLPPRSKTGDEIEFSPTSLTSGGHLRDAYTGLERKVAERTQELTVANEKLEEASQLKSQFLANVNHELRTPVSAIIGYARLVLRATEGQIAPLQSENLRDLLNNAERLLNQIDSLLEFSKIEAARRKCMWNRST